MKILLIFPPQWLPYRPYLSIPSLVSYLRVNGVDVAQRDFNIEAFDFMLSKDYLLGLDECLQKQFDELDNRDKLKAGIEQRRYNDLFTARLTLQRLSDRIEAAKSVFRSDEYYDSAKLAAARRCLWQALDVISTAYFPSQLDFASFEMPNFKGTYQEIKDYTIDATQNPYISVFEHLLKTIAVPYDLIGLSIASQSQLLPALTLARLIKRQMPAAHVTVGGYMVTALSGAICRNPELFEYFFDSAILCEGEIPLLNLVRRIENGQNLDGISNLMHRNGKDTVFPSIFEPAPSINSLPTPDFDGMPLQKYFSPVPTLPVLSSRGCYWGKCAFCTHNSSYGPYCKREALKVIEDLENLKAKYGAANFVFSDEGISPSAMNAICDEIIKRKLDVNCSTNIRIEKQFDALLCQKMARAGFKLLYLGLESACDRILANMDKGTDKNTAAIVCRNIVEAGIWNHLYVFFGFPTENRAEAEESVEFLLSNKKYIRSVGMGFFTLNRGSKILLSPERYGIAEVVECADFEMSFNYSLKSGLNASEAKHLSRFYLKDVLLKLASHEVFRHLSQEDLFLYLSRYGAQDLSLISIIKTESAKKAPPTKIRLDSKPMLKKSVSTKYLRFDLFQIRRLMAAGALETSWSQFNTLMCNAETGSVFKLNQSEKDFVEKIDGSRTLRQLLEPSSTQSAINGSIQELFYYLVNNDFVKL